MFLKTKIPPPIVTLIFALAIYFSSRYFIVLEIPMRGILSSIFIILGIFVTFSSARIFKKKETTIDPMNPDQATTLVTDGMFKITRNPLYLGMLLLLFGLSVFKGLIVGFIFLPLFVLYITIFQIIPEEEAMLNLFGEDYKSYSNRVRRWF